MHALAQWHLIDHGLFVSEPIGRVFYLHVAIFEIPMYYFIIKPPDVSIDICQLLLLFSIISPCFDECFLFYVITGRHYFSWKFIITLRFLKRNVVVFFEASVLKEVRILWVISTVTTAWKVSVFWVFLVRIFPHLDWIQRDTPYLSLFSPNAGKSNSEYGHFSCSEQYDANTKVLVKLIKLLNFRN